MNKKITTFMFIVGLILLLFISQFQFSINHSWKSWNLPLSGKIIILDAGHGGPDGGAVGADGTLEKDIALSITLLLKDYLQEAGALVLLTREDDYDLADENTTGLSRRKNEDLRERLRLVNESNGDLFLTIHLNAIPSSKWYGAQTFYHPHLEENKNIAIFIQEEIKRNLENTTRAAKPINNIYLLKNAKIPGALVEVGFLSNPRERELLKKEEYQEQMAAAIYLGVLRYFTEDEPPVTD